MLHILNLLRLFSILHKYVAYFTSILQFLRGGHFKWGKGDFLEGFVDCWGVTQWVFSRVYFWGILRRGLSYLIAYSVSQLAIVLVTARQSPECLDTPNVETLFFFRV